MSCYFSSRYRFVLLFGYSWFYRNSCVDMAMAFGPDFSVPRYIVCPETRQVRRWPDWWGPSIYFVRLRLVWRGVENLSAFYLDNHSINLSTNQLVSRSINQTFSRSGCAISFGSSSRLVERLQPFQPKGSADQIRRRAGTTPWPQRRLLMGSARPSFWWRDVWKFRPCVAAVRPRAWKISAGWSSWCGRLSVFNRSVFTSTWN